MSQNHLERIEALERRIEELERRIQDLERRSGPKVFTPHSRGLTERYRRKDAVREVLWQASLVPKIIPYRVSREEAIWEARQAARLPPEEKMARL